MRRHVGEPENNTEQRAAHLRLLARDHQGKGRDPVSTDYCVMAAYNRGGGTAASMLNQVR